MCLSFVSFFLPFHLERGQVRSEHQVRHPQRQRVTELVVTPSFWQHQQAVAQPQRCSQEPVPRGMVEAEVVQLQLLLLMLLRRRVRVGGTGSRRHASRRADGWWADG